MILQILFLPLLFSLLNYMVRKSFTGFLAGAVQCYVLGCCLYLFLQTGDAPITLLTGSVDFLGIHFVFSRTSGLFVLLTAFICTIVILYAMRQEAAHKLFVFLLFSVQSLMFVAFLADDLFTIYISLEICLLICAMLITYKREERRLFDGLVYLLTNIVGMLFFLFGVGYLYKIFGATSLTYIAAHIQRVPAAQLALPFAFLMTGACLKCAFLPLYFWLPKAHGTPGAPSVVSAILSGVFVKCGVFLFMRIRALFLPVLSLDHLFLIMGIITGVCGIVCALCQLDFKKILAYHTVSQMGLILIGISLNNTYAMSGALLHVVNHALFKALLFLCAGIITTSYGTKNITKIHGVMQRMPVVGVSLLAAILGITGAPFFNGSISKYFIQSGATVPWVEMTIILINLGTCLSFSKVAYTLFGKSETRYRVDVFTGLSLLLLAAGCFITGLAGEQTMNFLLGYTLHVNAEGYAEKAVLWLVFITSCMLFYRFVMKKLHFFKHEHSFEPTFTTINLCTVCFFGVILAFALQTAQTAILAG